MRGRKLLVTIAVAVIGTVGLAAAPAASGSAAFAIEVPQMTGSEVVPGPGDPDGTGSGNIGVVKPYKAFIKLSIVWGAETQCGFLYSRDHCVCLSTIGVPTAAHIHTGKSGEAGPVVATLFSEPLTYPGDGSKYCGDWPDDPSAIKIRDLPEKLLIRFGKKPGNFYMDVHSEEYPDGALRGQLAPDPYKPFDPDQYEKK